MQMRLSAAIVSGTHVPETQLATRGNNLKDARARATRLLTGAS
jgi:hypothetical protein